MKIRILRSAYDDLVDGRRFYDRQQKEAGDYFFDTLFSEIDSLALHAGIHRVHFGFHRLLARRFPFAIYYRIIRGEVIVFRIIDCRQNPQSIRSALKKRA